MTSVNPPTPNRPPARSVTRPAAAGLPPSIPKPAPAPVVEDPSAPPAAPRPGNPRATKRSWTEPRVRNTFVAAAALLLIAAYFAAAAVVEWSRESWLVRNGTVVQAAVYESGGAHIPNRQVVSISVMDFDFDYDGKPMTVAGPLPGHDQGIVAGTKVPIRIDPHDPTKFTALTEPPKLAGRMGLSGGIAAVAAVAGGIALLRRAAVLRVWRDGEAVRTSVVDVHTTAAAPFSFAVRCARADGSDKRLITVYLPSSGGRPSPGDPLWVILRPGNPKTAIPASTYA